MTLDDAYREKGRLMTELEFHQERLRRVDQEILQHLRILAGTNGNSNDPNVIESERLSSDKGSKITVRYPTKDKHGNT